MLIRVRGGDAGIKEYLEKGRKDGRDHDRAELDERVILSGDLELTDTVINGMDKAGERYLHITLAFKEDEVSREKLQAITDEFKQFAMTAYEADEYNFYAEAHLPKLKSYTHQKTGEFIERKPHIHIVIPEYNLLSERNLNPFGKVDQQTKFLEAFQEHVNAKYGLASPKDNRRIEFNDESAMIARYKGDYFKGSNHDLKERILSDVLDKGITSFDQFRAVLAAHGDTKTRNAGKAAEYLNVKPEGAAKGVNLKEYVFSREFIELPDVEKRRRLAGEITREYEAGQPPRPTPADYAERLREWHEVRAAELKYLNSGNRKAYAAYGQADPEQRRAILAERAASFYEKHRPAQEVAQEPPLEPQAPIRDAGRDRPAPTPLPSPERDGRQSDTVVGQHAAEHRERTDQGADAGRAEFASIKRELDAARLLATLSRTHGVMPEKYEVTKGKDGGDRIRAGRRNLNVSDFLTQELHLSWRDAAPILKAAYAEQTGKEAPQQARNAPRRDLWADYRREWQPQQRERREQEWKTQRAHEQDRRAELRRVYLAERRTVQNDRARKPADRKAALSLARMGKVTNDMQLREAISAEREALKGRYRMKPAEQYRAYLAERAGRGDADALAELRRQRVQAPTTAGERIEHKTPGNEGQEAAFLKRARYTVDKDGNVTYYDAQRRAMFTDKGPAVEFAQTERAALETGLRLALAKFGPNVRLRGTDEYKAQMVDIAADTGLRVDFSDQDLQDRYEQRREAIKAGRALIDQGAKLVRPAPERTETPEQEAQPERNPRKPDHSRGR